MVSAAETTAIPGTVTALEETLWTVYRSALDRFLSLQDGIVARSLTTDASGWKLTEPSALNTAEIVRTLFLLEAQSLPISGWNPRALLDRVVDVHVQKGDVQVTAAALWAAATGNDTRADALLALLREHVHTCSQSMTLAGVIRALCGYGRLPGRNDAARQLAHELLDRLLANQNARSGLFHSSAKRTGLMRRKQPDSLLSSQAYPILAIADYARTFDDAAVLSKAQRCADALTSLQGAQGPWWRRYDAATGAIIDNYPVFAVNQASAVPTALRHLQHQLGDRRYDRAIDRGIEWLSGSNELQQVLFDTSEPMVARSINGAAPAFTIDRELYSYEPARYLTATLTRPVTETPRA